MLWWRLGRREEPAGSENRRHEARRVQHLGVPVQQLRAGAVHLQSAVGLLRLRSDIRQVQRLWVRVGMRAKHLQNQQRLIRQPALLLAKKCNHFPFYFFAPLLSYPSERSSKGQIWWCLIFVIDGKVWCELAVVPLPVIHPVKTELWWIFLSHFPGICFLFFAFSE